MPFPEYVNTSQTVYNLPKFQNYYRSNKDFRKRVNDIYASILREKSKSDYAKNLSDLQYDETAPEGASFKPQAVEQVYIERPQELQQAYDSVRNSANAKQQSEQNIDTIGTSPDIAGENATSPFDRRLGRFFVEDNQTVVPFDVRFQDTTTDGYVLSEDAVKDAHIEKEEEMLNKIREQKSTLQNSTYHKGVPSLINTYALTRLYGSQGGQYLVDNVNSRQWYEIDQTKNNRLGFTKNPNTSALIQWGNADPYGRTPYHFTDFVFAKHWNIVENNRLITLRRFGAPIYDNMKFPGMEGANSPGNPQSSDDSNNPSNNGSDDGGSARQTAFPPMATAITYFGEETGNNLNEILKFTTGLPWEDVEAELFNVTPTGGTPDADSGPGSLYGNLTKYSKMLNVAQGNWNADAVLNKGNLPPDPYKDGPYTNRIIGPVNRINKVKKRAPGINFENTITLSFDYVARPIGGINTKAVLLDILSNFMVMSSATAMFWGGQHRFMGNPQQYPFIGGDKGIQQWYSGNPTGWAETTFSDFGQGVTGLGDMAKNFFSSLFGGGDGDDSLFGNIKQLFTGNSAGGNLIKQFAASKSSGEIPYLQGMKALLIGEPVGEWHVTIGNPLNPIARIGNLICSGVEVEFGNELGPDDFPLQMKFTVTLEHGMARDRDAIQSMFNRGMGRIYSLPDGFKGSADFETRVDNKTGNRDKTGRNPIYWKVPIADSGTVGGTFDKGATRENALHGSVSVWNRGKFSAVSPNDNLALKRDKAIGRSAYRSADWITKRTLT